MMSSGRCIIILNHLVVFNVPDESGLRSASQGSTSEDKVLIVGVVTPPVIIPVIPVVGGVHAAHLIVLVIHDVIGAPVVGIDLKFCLIRLKYWVEWYLSNKVRNMCMCAAYCKKELWGHLSYSHGHLYRSTIGVGSNVVKVPLSSILWLQNEKNYQLHVRNSGRLNLAIYSPQSFGLWCHTLTLIVEM